MKIKNYQLIILFCTISYLFFLGEYPLFDKDEPFFAGGAREMIERGSYITAHFNYEPRYEKPIFFYLLEILSFKAFGINEFTARLPSALLALALVLINYFSIKKINEKLALYSSLMLASSFEFFIIARMAITDMTLNFFMSLSLISFFAFYAKHVFENKDQVQDSSLTKLANGGHLYIAAFAIAGGLLTKGPIALLLPGFIVVVFLLFSGKLLYFIREYFLVIFLCLVISLALAVPWYLAADAESAGEFTKVFFLEENFNRFFSSVKIHKAGPWWFYFPVIIIGFMPWIFFFPQALLKLKNNFTEKTIQQSLLLFALIWFSSFFLFYSLSGVKLINYILPAYLPLSIITAYVLIDREKLFFVILTIAFVIYLAVSAIVLPYLNDRKQATLLKFVNLVPKQEKIYSLGFESPVAVFYAERRVHYIKAREFMQRVNNGETLFIVIRNSEYEKLPESYQKNIKIILKDKKNFYGHLEGCLKGLNIIK